MKPAGKTIITRGLRYLPALIAALASTALWAMWPRRDNSPFTRSPRVSLNYDPKNMALVVSWTQDPSGYNAFWFSAYDIDENTKEIHITRYLIRGLFDLSPGGEPSDAMVVSCDSMQNSRYSVFINDTDGKWRDLGKFDNPLPHAVPNH